MAQAQKVLAPEAHTPPVLADWEKVAYLLHVSRQMDEVEETRLVPEKQVLYQFSARGHDMAQILLGSRLTHRHDAICGYYRSRPVLLAIGVPLEEALAGPLAREGGYSGGRDIGVVFNYPNLNGPSALPMCGGVGAQYTPATGWAQAIEYRRTVLGEAEYEGAIAVVLGGEASVATNGFWSALTIATTQKLPVLFYIEDNGFGISVRSHLQTPGGNIAANLASFGGLTILDGDGTDPEEAARLTQEAVTFVREQRAPMLLRLRVPRLCGHSAQDTQGYKSESEIAEEKSRDPLPRLRDYLVPGHMAEEGWDEIEQRASLDVAAALERALARPQPDPKTLTRHVFSEAGEHGIQSVQTKGGLAAEGITLPKGSATVQPSGPRINMAAAIRRTLDHELSVNPRMVLFGEDVGPKGGVHSVSQGLQAKYGEARVFDTSLSEEGIIGRAVGMALAGLMPVPEIQFRKYADPAVEQLNDCGTLRWRTRNRFAAPIVVRMPGGFFKCGDPWHSQTNEVQFVHAIGWRVAVPSNAEDAVGLLRASLRGNDPVIFFEHRAMLDHGWARRPWPGDDYVLPFGKAKTVREGRDITVVTWGAMVERCEQAADMVAKESGRSVEVIDLRTLSPWDSEAVVASVRRTHRCLVVHEDNGTAGFGAEILAVVGRECFLDLDAPLERLTMPDIPSPHNPILLEAAVPSAEQIAAKIDDMVRF
ncbi:alpha-ketoacid dehydrogenase subunit alpha/beta [Pedomonas mirosovicensis]|uniref:alpha-ketoacid dehydrogenase subunit alpha/beta n=1 Tax=Pedomonas mirosovicensis TaxID=2908641 RepID=UPI002167770F|nr:transketolase C-terminal domain-containing protein [Pedomonas mirosovicensis]MCH8685710.1 thiamine pyrophosphate-dependent enzyme [Pedomonas mirosovicensis]